MTWHILIWSMRFSTSCYLSQSLDSDYFKSHNWHQSSTIIKDHTRTTKLWTFLISVINRHFPISNRSCVILRSLWLLVSETLLSVSCVGIYLRENSPIGQNILLTRNVYLFKLVMYFSKLLFHHVAKLLTHFNQNWKLLSTYYFPENDKNMST